MKITMELDNKDFRGLPAIKAFAKLIEELTSNDEQELEQEQEQESKVEAVAEHKVESTKEDKELPAEKPRTVVTKSDKKPKTNKTKKTKAEEPEKLEAEELEKLEAKATPVEAVHADEPKEKEVVQKQDPAPKTEEVPVTAITFEELKTTIMELNRQKSIARDLMSEFNIKCLSDIKPEDYERVINRAKELVA